ncbi:site-specific integrase [Allohahella marinimesophila]|uniref:Site-specific integrase n=1 Tax=Allohahella marinimesophila TaxID=1054972 RepID=A0ABP7PXM0_9GAMM
MEKQYGVNVFILDSGERYCHVVNRESCLPLYHPNLYLTTRVRATSASATVQSAAANLVVLLKFLDVHNIDLERRILSRDFLKEHELDALRDFCQQKIKRRVVKAESEDWVRSFKGNELSHRTVVQASAQHSRLTTAALYIEWLSKHLLGEVTAEDEKKIDRVESQIKARRPKSRGRNVLRLADRALDDNQVNILFEVIQIGSEFNPFAPDVQRRNRVMILLLFYLGLRSGELLSIKTSDIDPTPSEGYAGYLTIARRADEKSDPRLREPNAKTLDRTIPLKATLLDELYDYIQMDRRRVPNARKHNFLFVTHKAGPTVGQPLSVPSYQKMMHALTSAAPPLNEMTGHMLRHTWNDQYSNRMDADNEEPSERDLAIQEQVRSYLMGWKQGSGTASTYNRRFIEKKARQAALKMQATNGTRRPENLNGE